MFGWGVDEEHSIALPPRLSGRDSWTDERGSEDRNVLGRGKDKTVATKKDPGTASRDGTATENRKHGGKDSEDGTVDSSVALAGREAAHDQVLGAHELPGPHEWQEMDPPASADLTC